MKIFYKTLLIVVTFMLALSSCSVSKRHYMRGHYVQWHSSKHVESAPVVKQSKKQVGDHSNNVAVAKVKNETIALIEKEEKETDLTLKEKTKGSKIFKDHSVSTTVFNSYTGKNIRSSVRDLIIEKSIPGSAGDSGTSKGLKMILVGLLLILIGYLLYYGLGYSVAGYLIFLIFTIGGAVYALVGLYYILFT